MSTTVSRSTDQARRAIRWVRTSLVCAGLLQWAHLSAGAQEPATASPASRAARSWAVDAANNEVTLIRHSDSYLRYKYHVIDEKGDQTRDQIETPQGSVARLLLRNGRPLTEQEDTAERERLNSILQS